MEALDDAVGIEKMPSLFTKPGVDPQKPDGMFEPAGITKPQYWDLASNHSYEDYDMVNVAPKKHKRIMYKNVKRQSPPSMCHRSIFLLDTTREATGRGIRCMHWHS